MSNKSKVKSAQRTLRFLELLAKNRNGLSFTEIQEDLEMPKSSTHNLIQEFIDNNYLVFNEDKKVYYAGLEYIKLCTTCIQNTDLLEELSLLTSEIGKELNQTTHAGVLDQNNIMYLSKHETNTGLSLMNSVGIRLPAHCTALGKILLSQFNNDKIESMYENYNFVKITENSVDSLEKLLEELDITRKNKYGLEVCEASIYTVCISLPLFSNNEMIAAVSTTLPVQAFQNVDIKKIIAVMKKHIKITEKRIFA